MLGRDDVVEVVLEEGDGPPLRPRRSPDPSREAGVLRAAAAALALATALAVTVQGAGLAAREGRAAGATGLVADLSAPLREVWTGPAGEYLGSVGDLLVLAGPGDVRAVDVADGHVVWRLDDLPRRIVCSIADLCAANPPWSPADGAGGVMFTAGRVLVLAGARDGVPSAEGWSLLTGQRAWAWSGDPAGLTIWTHAADRLWLVAAQPVALDAATGERVSADAEITLAETALAGGATARTVLRPRGDPELVLTDLAGTELPRVSGYQVPPAVRDAPLDRVLPVVLVGGGMAGIDLGTGDRVWETPDRFVPVAEVSGVLVSLAAGGMAALDVTSGRPLWSAARGGAVDSVVSDGMRLAYVDPSGPDLVVVDARDGHEVRRQALAQPGSTTLTPVPDGRVLQSGAGGVALLAPDV